MHYLCKIDHLYEFSTSVIYFLGYTSIAFINVNNIIVIIVIKNTPYSWPDHFSILLCICACTNGFSLKGDSHGQNHFFFALMQCPN